MLGRAEELLHLGFPPDRHRRDDPAEALGARREQQVPRERVHGRAAREGVAVHVAVDCRERPEVDDEHEHRGDLVEVLGEAAGAGGRLRGELVGVGHRARLGLAVGDGRPGHEAVRAHREVSVPVAEVDVADRAPRRRVAHDDDPPSLAVPAARREARGVEDAVEDVVGHRITARLRRRSEASADDVPAPAASTSASAAARGRDIVDLVVFVVITGALVIGGWLLVGPTSQARALEGRYPVALLPALDQVVAEQGPDARLFNEYTWGGWLIETRPDLPVFIDGRSEVYGDPQLERYAAIAEGGPDAVATLDELGVTVVLVKADCAARR